MAYSLAQITILGNAGQDGELRYTPNGHPVLNFSLAYSHSQKVGEEWKSETDWWRVVVLGKFGESMNGKILKGNKVLVVGTPRVKKWEAQDGTKNKSVEILADKVIVLTKNAESSGATETSEDESAVPF